MNTSGEIMNRPFVKIAVLEDTFEAQLLQSVLTERNIAHRIDCYHDTAYDGLFQTQKGWGAVFGPEDQSKEIFDLLKEVRNP